MLARYKIALVEIKINDSQSAFLKLTCTLTHNELFKCRANCCILEVDICRLVMSYWLFCFVLF